MNLLTAFCSNLSQRYLNKRQESPNLSRRSLHICQQNSQLLASKQNVAISYLLQRYGLAAATQNAGKAKFFCSVFCLGNYKPLSLMTGLILPHMLGLVSVSLPSKHVFTNKKKIGGEDADFFFLFF
jgi:hypothetical protein